jgi:hypothetical protein
MAKKTKIILVLSTFAVLTFISGCANQLPPGGGEIDTIPPKIIESVPANGTINYGENYFEITFSKYVDKRSVQDAIFISPSLQRPVNYSWSGKTLNVIFNDTLKPNTTYTITIGTDVKDLNNGNKMAESFLLTFSTGNKIDIGKVSGKVFNERPEGIMIFAFKENGNEFDIDKQKPDYISQVGKNGNYGLQGMGDGKYKILAILDKFRDYKYQKNEDEYGVQTGEVNLKESASTRTGFDFMMTMEDTLVPKITNAFMRDRNHLLVQFSKAIDSSKISASNFYLKDTTANNKVMPKYFYKGETKPNQFILGIVDSLEVKDSWQLFAKDLIDFKNNFTSLENIPISIKEERDTTSVILHRIMGTLNEGKVDYEKPQIKLIFSGPVDSSSLKEKLTIQDEKKSLIPFKIEREDDAVYKLRLTLNNKQSENYTVLLNYKNYKDVFGNDVDSLFNNKFTTSNELDFSGASGTVSNLPDSSDVIVSLQNVNQNKIVYEQIIGKKRKFEFKKINPGKYLLMGFNDKNKNHKYDYGSIKPYSYSEEFRYYPDTLNLRARWPVGDINLSFEKN